MPFLNAWKVGIYPKKRLGRENRIKKITDGCNPVCRGDLWKVFDVELVKLGIFLVGALVRKLFENRRNYLAWATPIGVEIDKDDLARPNL